MKNTKKLLLVMLSLLSTACVAVPTPGVSQTTEQTTQQTTVQTTEQTTVQTTEQTSDGLDPDGLIINDLELYVNYPDMPTVQFVNPEDAEEITYEIVEGPSTIYHEDGLFYATAMGEATVYAYTSLYETYFTVRCNKSYTFRSGYDWHNSRITDRYNTWRSKGAVTGGTVWVGDSFFDPEFFSNFYSVYTNNNVFLNGVSASVADDWFVYMNKLILPMKPSQIVMHIGTNDIWDQGQDANAVYNDLVQLFTKIHTKLPNTKIYWFAIEPRTGAVGGGTYNQATYNKVIGVNNQVKTYCASNSSYLTYLDVTSNCYTSGITVNSSFFRDGVHPVLSNYKHYVMAVESAGANLSPNFSVYGSTTTSLSYTNASAGVAASSQNVQVAGTPLSNKYCMTGTLKFNSLSTNAHMQFNVDGSNFNNRFLLWDNDSNGNVKPTVVVNNNHDQCKGVGTKSWGTNTAIQIKILASAKNVYFYLDNHLSLIILNVNPTTLNIGTENCTATISNITAFTAGTNPTQYNSLMSDSTITSYEARTDYNYVNLCA